MKRVFKFSVLAVIAAFLSACDTGPNGFGTAPPGVSQSEWDAQQRAKREAYRKCMSGPRPGGGTERCDRLR